MEAFRKVKYGNGSKLFFRNTGGGPGSQNYFGVGLPKQEIFKKRLTQGSKI